MESLWKAFKNLVLGESEESEPRRRVHLYQSVLNALVEGYPADPRNNTPMRPALPTELALLIVRYAALIQPHACPVTPGSGFHTLTAKKVSAGASGEVNRRVWFRTPPFTRQMLDRTAEIQLFTYSHDQGWCSNRSHGSWSWFEVSIVRNVRNAPSSPTPSPESDQRRVTFDAPNSDEPVRRWKSHNNPIASRSEEWLEGIKFGVDHEIWNELRVGDMIEVLMCAQFGGWQNLGSEAFFRIWEFWSPAGDTEPLMGGVAEVPLALEESEDDVDEQPSDSTSSDVD